mmetsp:Transcript_45594/g.72388  ORF Transcript_45594/g.72388 Transcript_45594/m.72388 type:complete len:278 (-) Transcript_45594:24-857(-)
MPIDFSAHGRILHRLRDFKLPKQALPPLEACVATALERDCCPFPHECEHSFHSFHSVKLQSTGAFGPVKQEAVSLREFNEQAFPLKAPGSSTFLDRYLLSRDDAHADQELHSPSTQSLSWQFASHAFVLFSVPSHGLPHSLFGTATVRWRVQMPSQKGLLHSDHPLNSQSFGAQASQAGKSHGWTSDTVPLQSFLEDATARGLDGLWSVIARVRWRTWLPAPQVFVHAENFVHSLHAHQYNCSPHSRGHLVVCIVSDAWHSSPPNDGCCMILLERNL